MIFDISDLPESKYAFSRKCLYVSVCVRVRVRVRVCVCVYVYVCKKFVCGITRKWTGISSLSLADT